MNDPTPEELREHLLAGVPEAPEVDQWPSQIGRRIAVRRRRAAALRATAAVAVLGIAAGVMWRASTISTPATPDPVALGTPSTAISPSTAPASDSLGPDTLSATPSVPSSAAQSSTAPSPTTPTIPPPTVDSSPPTLPATQSITCGDKATSVNPATLPQGAVTLMWCTDVGNLLAAPQEALEGSSVDQIAQRYNALPGPPDSQCIPEPGTSYRVLLAYPDGKVVELDGDLGPCDRVGGRQGSITLTTALGRAYDQQRRYNYPEIEVTNPCGSSGVPHSTSLVAFPPGLLTVGYRCEKGQAVPLPSDVVDAMARGLSYAPSDLVLEPEGVWLVAFTAAGDPLTLWVSDGWVWAKRLTTSGNPNKVQYVGWEPSPAQLKALLGR